MKLISGIDISARLNDLYQKGQDRGYSSGFKGVDPYYRVKLGCTTYITGIPSHGKSQFLFDMLMNLSINEGVKHVLFTPETGETHDVWIKLIEMYTRKRFSKHGYIGEHQMSQKDLSLATGFLSEFFRVIDPMESSTSPQNFLEFAESIQQDFPFQTLTLDPWNELDHDFTIKAGREDKYLEFTLGEVRRASRKMQIHTFLVAHPRTKLRNAAGDYDAPTAYEISGGAPWYSKAESIICVHRPDEMIDSTEIIIQKAKPAIIGKKGKATLNFNIKTGRYDDPFGNPNPFNPGAQVDIFLPPNELF